MGNFYFLTLCFAMFAMLKKGSGKDSPSKPKEPKNSPSKEPKGGTKKRDGESYGGCCGRAEGVL